jgi:hypothetical protein
MTGTGAEEVKYLWARLDLASAALAAVRSPGGPRFSPPSPESVCFQVRAPAAGACEWRLVRPRAHL